MIWRLVVPREWAAPIKSPLGIGLEFSYVQHDRDAVVYLPPAIAQIVGWWHRNYNVLHWGHVQLACWLGVMSMHDGDFYRNAWWAWGFSVECVGAAWQTRLGLLDRVRRWLVLTLCGIRA